MTHFGAILHSSLVEPNQDLVVDPNVSALEFFIANPPDLGTLKDSFALIAAQNEPKVSTDLFDRIRTNIAQALDTARDERTSIGEFALNIDTSLNKQIAIREAQRAETFDFIRKIEDRISAQLVDLGETTKGESGNPFEFITDNPLLSGLSVGVLAVGGIVLLLLLRK